MDLTAEQEKLLNLPIPSKIFLQGMAGTGKTTAGTYWLKKLLQAGIPAHDILVFVPQRALANPYQESLREAEDYARSLMTTVTLGGLARRMVELYWPLISREAGMANPDLPPNFLTMETAQYYMAHLVRPLIETEGYFESLTIDRNRIYSQILDNLNKAAIVGFDIHQIGERLTSAWVGELEQIHVYEDVQQCVNRFRSYCLENNLLDFSLQVEIFLKHLWHLPTCRDYLTQSFRHLIVDNIEEDTPVAHDILTAWIPSFDSALVIYDENAGYRFFLGADVQSAFELRNVCDFSVKFEQNLVNSPGINDLKHGFINAVSRLQDKPQKYPDPTFDLLAPALGSPVENPKYFPQMVEWVTDQITELVAEGTPPGEIVILAPFMPDVLKFALSTRLDELHIPNVSHRPSRSLREEPATQTMLTLSAIGYPTWEMKPKRINLAYALMQAIDGLDLVRAQLLTSTHNKNANNDGWLPPFEDVPAQLRERITYRIGKRYDRLRNWLIEASQDPSLPMDFFMNRLFGEVLSQPGFGFYQDLDSGNTIANLIESIQKFRWAVGAPMASDPASIGKEYLQMVQDGVIAAQYMRTWGQRTPDSVFLSPAYTFLINNQAVDYQFWLDIGSPSWYQRLDQPLTQPYVLSRNWEKDAVWDAEDELKHAQETLSRLSIGLLNRCRKKVFIGMSELDIRGYENSGLLIRIFQNILQNAQRGRR